MLALILALVLLSALADACNGPTPLSPSAPNVLLIGDSISMGSSGYSLFVQQMLQLGKDKLIGSVQHGGGFGRGGQMASSAGGAEKVKECMGNKTGTLKPKAWSVITCESAQHLSWDPLASPPAGTHS